VTREVRHVVEVLGAPDGEVPPVAGVQRVRGRIEQVTAERNGQREHHRVASAEEVNWPIFAEPALAGRDDVHQVGVAVLVHQWDDGAQREDVQRGAVGVCGQWPPGGRGRSTPGPAR